MELVTLALGNTEESSSAREELLDRCKDVMSYHVQKYKMMYNGRLNHFDVEDLVSECHIAVLESIKLYKPDRGSGFSNFAKFVIRNRIINLLKHKIVQNKVIDFAIDVNKVNHAAPEPYEERQLTITATTERDKMIIAMVLDGYTQVEVAQKYGLTKGRVNQILKKYVK